MPDLGFYTDLFEMIAAVAALGVTAILYLETCNMRNEMREMRNEMLRLRDQTLEAKT